MVDAHAEDLEQLRVSGAKHGDVADVGVLLRAIQSGADVVPAKNAEIILPTPGKKILL